MSRSENVTGETCQEEKIQDEKDENKQRSHVLQTDVDDDDEQDEFHEARSELTLDENAQDDVIVFPEDEDEEKWNQMMEEERNQVSKEELEERSKRSSELKQEGNEQFKEQNFDLALDLYSQALKICPLNDEHQRSILFSNRAISKVHLFELQQEERGKERRESSESDQVKDENERKKWKEERIKDAIADCSRSLKLEPNYLKPLLRRSSLYKELGDEFLDSCLKDFQKLSELNPSNDEYKQEIFHLESRIRERNEKLKDEMISKLKQVGDFVLRPFGISTNNFNLVQNENGGYSVNFKQ